jgi:type II secretory pathway pseudopilin PulG
MDYPHSPQQRLSRLLPRSGSRSGAPGPARDSRGRRLRRRLADERGITIVELLATMAVMTIVGGALTSVIAAATKAEVRTNRTFQAQLQGRLALDKLRRELHCASAATIVNGSGTQLAAGSFGQGVRVTLGGYCPTNGLTTTASQTVYVTWCTLSSTKKAGTYALYRLASLSSQPACASSGMKWADYLTVATPFCLPSTTAACGGVYRAVTSLPTLRVYLPVNLNGPTTTKESFNLVDDIALRNSARG